MSIYDAMVNRACKVRRSDTPWIGGIPSTPILNPIAMPCDMETIPIRAKMGRGCDIVMMDEAYDMGVILTWAKGVLQV